MHGLMAGLLVAIVVMALSLAVAALGGLGIAAVGWMLSRFFELTQWQGSLIALGVALGVGYVLTQIATPAAPSPVISPEWVEWEGEEEDEAVSEPSVVPWRRERPTPGELPEQRPARRTKGRH